MLMPPSIDECVSLAKHPNICLPEREARKFWAHYESNGWKVGKNPVVSLMGAMVGWKMRWEERGGGRDCNGAVRPELSGIDKSILSKELERVLEKMRIIRTGYSENMQWTLSDVARFNALRARRNELREKLGIKE